MGWQLFILPRVPSAEKKYHFDWGATRFQMSINTLMITHSLELDLGVTRNMEHLQYTNLGRHTLFLLENKNDKASSNMRFGSLFMLLFVCYQQQIRNDVDVEICLAALLILAPRQIISYLSTLNTDDLKTNMQTQWTIVRENVMIKNETLRVMKRDQLDILSRVLRKWRFNTVWQNTDLGKNMIHRLRDVKRSNDCYCSLLFARCCFKMKGIIKQGLAAHVTVIGWSTSLHVTTLSLRDMYRFCRKEKRYVCALRFLNIAKKLCTLYELTITPTFVNKIYPKKRKKIKKKLKKMECLYCGSKGKLYSCTACMSALYCSKLCQKRDWKEHKHHCSKIKKGVNWLDFYRNLKSTKLFQPIPRTGD